MFLIILIYFNHRNIFFTLLDRQQKKFLGYIRIRFRHIVHINMPSLMHFCTLQGKNKNRQ